jgi:hypothetical protein
MKWFPVLMVALISVASAAMCADWDVIFSDDFNRPDGPLGPPWLDYGPDALSILAGRAALPQTGYGLSGFDDSESGPSMVLEMDFGFEGDEDGYFHAWIGGADGAGDTVAYGAEFDRSTFGLYSFPPESLLVEAPFDFDPYTVYTMRLAYDHSTGIASLSVRDALGVTGDSLGVPGPSTNFTMIRVGFENEVHNDKWLDNVVLRVMLWSGVEAWPGSSAPRIELYPPYPNPCRDATVIAYELPAAGDVSIAIYNTQGQEVRRWYRSEAAPGYHEQHWDATSGDGRRVSPGVYLCSVRSGVESASRKLIVTD